MNTDSKRCPPTTALHPSTLVPLVRGWRRTHAQKMGRAASAHTRKRITCLTPPRSNSVWLTGEQHGLLSRLTINIVASKTQIPPRLPISTHVNPAYGRSGSSSSVGAEEDIPFDDGKREDSDDTATGRINERYRRGRGGGERACCRFASSHQAGLWIVLGWESAAAHSPEATAARRGLSALLPIRVAEPVGEGERKPAPVPIPSHVFVVAICFLFYSNL